MTTRNYWRTTIIGGGQAGLATAYYLKKSGEDFIIIDEGTRIGDVWRKRWDSLRLFTPAKYNGLPGFPFPSQYNTYPTKDEMADYLEEYAIRFNLPTMLGTRAIQLSKTSSGFKIVTSNGTFTSNAVVICTGSNPSPYIPDFASEIDKNIFQIHSSQYRNPDLVPKGDTLVVGVGTSGVEIAIELSKSRRTLIAGKPVPEIPYDPFRYVPWFNWWFAHNISTIKAPFFLQAKRFFRGGTPLIRFKLVDLDEAGVERLPRVSGIINGNPLLADGKEIAVSNIIWATGYKPDFSWIDFDVTDETDWLKGERGISSAAEGLYYVGMWFQFALTSAFIGGVGRDAEFVANHIKSSKHSSAVTVVP